MRFLFSILATTFALFQATLAHAQHAIGNTPGFVDFCNVLAIGFIDMAGGLDTPYGPRPLPEEAHKPTLTPRERKRYLVADPIVGEHVATCARVIEPSELEKHNR